MEGGSEREKKRAKPGSSRTRLSFMARQMVLCPPPQKGGQKVTKIAEFTILFGRGDWRRTLTRYSGTLTQYIDSIQTQDIDSIQ